MFASRLIQGACLGALVLQASVAVADSTPPDKVSFYFAAHEDDWQLFMNPSAFEDVTRPNAKAVFVHVTAGDAGYGRSNRGRRFPYYLARESGAETAIRFMADSAELPTEKSVSTPTIHGHPIYRVAYRNTVTYFLRLPDGSPTGVGYQDTGRQSLQRLADGQIDTLAAIDGSTSYRGWGDLVATLRAIEDRERGSAAVVQLNVAEPDARVNPHDHSDHLMVSRAATEAAAGLSCARRRYFVDYASAKLPANLDTRQSEMESAVVAVTAAGLLALDHGGIWQPYFRSYLGRNYFREDAGSGPCSQAAQLTVKKQPLRRP